MGGFIDWVWLFGGGGDILIKKNYYDCRVRIKVKVTVGVITNNDINDTWWNTSFCLTMFILHTLLGEEEEACCHHAASTRCAMSKL